MRPRLSRCLRVSAMQSARAVPLSAAQVARSSGVASARSGPLLIVNPAAAEGAGLFGGEAAALF